MNDRMADEQGGRELKHEHTVLKEIDVFPLLKGPLNHNCF